jgi:hypothetical protein
VDAAVARATARKPRAVKLVDPTPREMSVAYVQNLRPGEILRSGDVRAVKISTYDASPWLIDPGDARATDAEIAARGPWAVEAHAPTWKRHREIVYIDLDGTGRKIYAADAARWEVERYEQARKAYEKAHAKGEDVRAPSSIGVYEVTHKGLRYALVPTAWFGVTDATAWKLLSEPTQTRRATAQASADRRTLSPGAARALDALVLYVLSDPRDRSPWAMNAADLWRDLTNNRANVFGLLLNDHQIGAGRWTQDFTPEGDDAALLDDAMFAERTGTRLIAGSLRRLLAEGWIEDTERQQGGTGYIRSARTLSDALRQTLTDSHQSDAGRVLAEARNAQRLLEREHGGASGYAYSNAPAYVAFMDAQDAVRTALAAVDHPFATQRDVEALRAATERLRALSAR